MFIQCTILLIIGFVLYKIADYYARRYLGFNSTDHTPEYTPGSSDSAALVCVLGWGGCTRRHLRRLLEFYSSQGTSTVSWINPMFNYLFGVDRKQVERVLDFLLHENRHANQIIIHLHSNNGSLVWGHMLQIMKTNQYYSHLLPNIKGVILDSAPYVHLNGSSDWLLASAIGASRACVSIILNRAQYYHYLWSPLISYYLFLRFFYRKYLSSDSRSSSDKVLLLLNASPVNVKQCYLYSDSDRLIPHQIIEQFINKQKDRGVLVTSHRFADSGHVNHFRLYPTEYGQLILNFIVKNKNSPLVS
ncbi:unnamed protein product [Adineta ricciae]|uniref:Transmembrane protein 53 n=1 Tax=Adineta ricciae TaxID=249248 RepID=A0A814PA79_ADIRI|nr:unnamed protein product [Adineta ricciae]CAF1103514.1 unnamed protein product [Adineta ricciae]